MFKQAKQNRVFQDVVEQIQDAILGGKLAPRHKNFRRNGNSRICSTPVGGTLREALRVLEQKGLIEIKLGVAGGPL